jgi:hypothetical protein
MNLTTTTCPDNCPDCPMSERRHFLYFCRHYKRECTEGYEHRPEYCKVETISIEEEEK